MRTNGIPGSLTFLGEEVAEPGAGKEWPNGDGNPAAALLCSRPMAAVVPLMGWRRDLTALVDRPSARAEQH